MKLPSGIFEEPPMMIPCMMRVLKTMAGSLEVLSSLTFNPDSEYADVTSIGSFDVRVGFDKKPNIPETFENIRESAGHEAKLTYAFIERIGNAQILPLYEAMQVWEKLKSVHIQLSDALELVRVCKEIEITRRYALNGKLFEIVNGISRTLESINNDGYGLTESDTEEIAYYMEEYWAMGSFVWDLTIESEELQGLVDEGIVILSKLRTAGAYMKITKPKVLEKIKDIMEPAEHKMVEFPDVPIHEKTGCEGNHVPSMNLGKPMPLPRDKFIGNPKSNDYAEIVPTFMVAKGKD